MNHPATGAILALCGLMAGVAAAFAGAPSRFDGAGGENLVHAPGEAAVRDPVHGWRIERRPAADDPAAKSLISSAEECPVYYLAGRTPDDASRRILTGKLAVELATGVPADEVARDYQLSDLGAQPYAPAVRLFRCARAADALVRLAGLRHDPRVVAAEALMARLMVPRNLPDDPLFPLQWNLSNLGQFGGVVGIDINVTPLWGTFGGDGTRGRGIRIGVVDDGLEAAHPDLAGRVDLANDRNWNDGAIGEGAATAPRDRHGMAVAGLIAAAGNNARGICGVAPEATLVSLRLIAGPVDDQDEAEAFVHLMNGTTAVAIKNNSWGPPDETLLLTGPGMLARNALANATLNGRAGRGTVFVFSVGNGGAFFEDSNYDGYANDPHVIAVGAVDQHGNHAAYSEPGANIAVCAPSDAGPAHPPIVTTDRSGDAGFNPSALNPTADLEDRAFTRQFGGTSAAAATVSGVCALMLETNPALGWRDVKEILMRTARQVDLANDGWHENAAGFRFHHEYGAGLVDAAAACAQAAAWHPAPVMRELQVGNSTPGSIPDAQPEGLVRSISVAARRRVEHVLVRTRITHPIRGDLRLALTSPAGTTAILASSHYDPFDQANYLDWTFTTVHMWGEPAFGTWTLRITDEVAGDEGTFEGATLVILGTDAGPPPVITSVPASRAVIGREFSHQVTTVNGPATVSLTGPMPPGLNFDPASRLLSGIPTQRGIYPLQFTASNTAGQASQTFTLRVLSRFESWLTDFDLLDPTTVDDDPDHDSMPLVAEYACGESPVRPNDPHPGTVILTPSTGQAEFSFRRLPARDDVDYHLEFSEDLKSWKPAARSIRGTATAAADVRFVVFEGASANDAVAVHVMDIQTGAASAWFRLRFLITE